jgi:hypothetical protein
MAATVRLEAHEVATRSGLPCAPCGQLSIVEVDVAIVASDSLTVLGRYTGSVCTRCGDSSEHR